MLEKGEREREDYQVLQSFILAFFLSLSLPV